MQMSNANVNKIKVIFLFRPSVHQNVIPQIIELQNVQIQKYGLAKDKKMCVSAL